MTERSRRRGWLLAACAVALWLLIVSAARADEPAVEAGTVRTHSPATCRTDGGSDLRLPPGYFLPETEYNALDASLKSLQDDRTRLTAENQSLRASATERSSAWLWAGVAGAVAGVLVGAIWL